MFSAPGRDEPAGGDEPEGESREEPPPPPEAGPIPEKPVTEPEPGPAGTGEPVEPPPSGKKPLTFDTSDLDKIGRTAELGKEQVEDFLDVLKEREEAEQAGPARRPGVRGKPAALGRGDQGRWRRAEP